LGSWLERHVAAWTPGLPGEAFGLDVAASESGDSTVLAAGGSQGGSAIHRWRGSGTMATGGRVLETAAQHGVDLTRGDVPIVVDTDGLGKGVGDRLTEKGCKVIFHHGSARADDPAAYGNMRAESYGDLGKRLDPAGPWPNEAW